MENLITIWDLITVLIVVLYFILGILASIQMAVDLVICREDIRNYQIAYLIIFFPMAVVMLIVAYIINQISQLYKCTKFYKWCTKVSLIRKKKK